MIEKKKRKKMGSEGKRETVCMYVCVCVYVS